MLLIIRELLNLGGQSEGTDIAAALEYLNNVQKKRAITFLLSDFMQQDYESALNIASRKHDIIGMHLFDKAELDLPNVGLLQVRDSETGQMSLIDTSNKAVREKYKSWFDDNMLFFKNQFNKNGLDTISMAVDQDYIKVLLKFFKSRVK